MNTIHYQKGLHILSTLSVENTSLMTNCENWLEHTSQLLIRNELTEVGRTFHIFPNDSFTAAFCLKESHICIHTWPEFSQVSMDIYVCNLMEDNTQKAKLIYEDLIRFFGAKIVEETSINR